MRDSVDDIVLGAGTAGMAVGEALVRRGESVRVVTRSGRREPIAGVPRQPAISPIVPSRYDAHTRNGHVRARMAAT
jgi:cation diffusion facilitator CzcD-associated flavoprotein CzcO